jgi:hypothetical protein
MHKLVSLVVLILLMVSAVPFLSVNASPTTQFAGCVDELGEEFGAHYIARSLNGFTFTLTAVGVGEFDPEITVKDAEGKILACNGDSDEASAYGVKLPSVEATPNERSAQVRVTVPGDQGRFDYEIFVTSADGKSGEFVLFYQGAEVFGSDNRDAFSVFTNQGMADAEVPLVFYGVNLQRPEIAIDPEITFSYGEDLVQTCSKSSADSLCQGEHEDLTGFTVTTDKAADVELNGDDVMLAYTAGGDPSEFTLEVGSYQAASFGPYTLIIHSGVGYPEETSAG